METLFVLDDDQRAILDTVRRFGLDVIAPVASELDRRDRPEDCFSWELVEKSDEAGIRTMTLSEGHGGVGASSLTTAMVIEELARYDMGFAVVMAQTLKLAQILQTALNDDQRSRYIPKFRDNPRCVLAIGITEPETASNYFVPHRVPDAPFHTKAEKVDGGWKINGMKHFISNGNVAGIYLLFAQTEKGKGLAEGATCFLIEKGTPGFTIGRVHDKMGERLANNAELIFQDCFVPDEDVVGVPGNGFQVLVDFFPASNGYAAATVLGVAAAAYDRAVEWARTRNQGGKLLIEHDGIIADMAECHMLLEVARSYIHRAVWAADNRDLHWDPTYGSLPKVFASQAAWKVVTRCSEIHGGSGFMRDIGFEKLIRDAAAFLHSDGVNRTLLLKAAKHLF